VVEGAHPTKVGASASKAKLYASEMVNRVVYKGGAVMGARVFAGDGCGADVPRCACNYNLRGHERSPAHDHRARAAGEAGEGAWGWVVPTGGVVWLTNVEARDAVRQLVKRLSS